MRYAAIIFLILLTSATIIFHDTSAEPSFSVKTEDEEHHPGDVIDIRISATDSGVAALEIGKPDGSIIYYKCYDLQPWTQTISIRLPEHLTTGNYTLFVTVLYRSFRMTDQVNYTIQVVEKSNEDRGLDYPDIPIPAIAGSVVIFGCFSIIWLSDRGRYLLLVTFFLPLYTRLHKDIAKDLEQMNNRGRIYQHIKENPGTDLIHIKKQVETGNGTTVYHLKVLEDEGYIIRKANQYFMKTTKPPIFGNMKRPLKERSLIIIDAILNNPGSTEKTLAHILQIPQQSVNRELNEMISYQIVRRGKTLGVFSYELADEFTRWYSHIYSNRIRISKITCSRCGNTIPVAGAMYCPFCSNKIEPASIRK